MYVLKKYICIYYFLFILFRNFVPNIGDYGRLRKLGEEGLH